MDPPAGRKIVFAPAPRGANWSRVPDISIITLFHNRWDLARRYIDQWRAARSGGAGVELILGDSASSDGSAEVASSASDIADVTLFQENLGFARGNNRLARRARGDLLVFLNYDVHLVPGWLEALAAVFSGRPGLGIAGNVQFSVRARVTDHAGIFFDSAGKPFHFRPPAGPLEGLGFLTVPAVTGACMAIRRELFESLGGFDEGYRNSYEDVDLCMRARASGAGVGLAARSAIWHHVSSSPGRYNSEETNAVRFAERWEREAIALSAIHPPELPVGAGQGAVHPVLAAYETLQAYFPSALGYSEEDSATLIYSRSRWEEVEVPLSPGFDAKVHPLRLDPAKSRGRFRLSRISLRIEGESRPFWEATGSLLAGACRPSGTCRLQSSGGELCFESDGDDPQLLIRLPADGWGRKERIWFAASLWSDCREESP